MKADPAAVAVVSEVVDVLAPHGRLPCHPLIQEDDGLWTLTLTFRPAEMQQSLQLLELVEDLRRVQDVAQIRGFADRYGVDAKLLEGLFF